MSQIFVLSQFLCITHVKQENACKVVTILGILKEIGAIVNTCID